MSLSASGKLGAFDPFPVDCVISAPRRRMSIAKQLEEASGDMSCHSLASKSDGSGSTKKAIFLT